MIPASEDPTVTEVDSPSHIELLAGVTDKPVSGVMHCTVTAAEALLSQLAPVVYVAVTDPPA
jgi:hypothetical protein